PYLPRRWLHPKKRYVYEGQSISYLTPFSFLICFRFTLFYFKQVYRNGIRHHRTHNKNWQCHLSAQYRTAAVCFLDIICSQQDFICILPLSGQMLQLIIFIPAFYFK
ncbi:MAG: hypothetical protein IJC94_03650, partial [Oscillospiraceae bacterium]|nr:hypothetical protein [Oscillospiraceae bacterium]